jgi:large subunit ribosomal protein L24
METVTKMKLKKGDQVLIIAGKEKGKTGTITKVSPTTNRVVVAGLNMIKKATKPDPQSGEGGGILEKEAPIHASNVMFLDPKTGKGSRKRPQ